MLLTRLRKFNTLFLFLSEVDNISLVAWSTNTVLLLDNVTVDSSQQAQGNLIPNFFRSIVKAVSVIIPAMNEAEGIGCTLEALPIVELSKLGYSTEVLVVDGCSTDNTLEIARSKGAKIIVEPRRGYGRAYKTGFQNSVGDYIVTMDADGSYPAQQIPQLLDYLVKSDLDLVTTCRLNNLQPGAMSVSHRFGNEILNLFSRVFFRLNLRDTQSGMWVFKRSLLETVGVRSDSMAFSQEFKIRSFQKASCQELPISYIARKGKQKINTFRDGYSNLKSMCGLLRNKETRALVPALGAQQLLAHNVAIPQPNVLQKT
ncbi:hypothetical protein AUI06_11480 [archaeon 13_2_20CM_2_52_21]|nr:MAG: hypothetical protein AUI06_11480 [archaeon 13_2_20CM_2_52_21]OLD44523.1 MAG: hypothetical protein AUI51_01795 [archaeon 13_1_40CM_2_52_4]